jgi:predicted amidophosphoribosyltransferase
VPELLSDLARGALDLLWPRDCKACGTTLGGTREPWLCAPCRAGLPLFSEDDTLCAVCARPLGRGTAGGGCPDCRRLRPRFEAVRAAGAYRGTLRRLVVGMKYAGRPDRAWPLGDLLAARLAGWGPARGVALVVPFPTTASARRRRGFDPPERIAEEVALRLGLPLAARVLERTGEPRPQASLPRGERLRAPRGTVRVRRPEAVAGRAVLLVDDVLTTGATADAAARALLRAGASRVLVAVAARA